MRVMGRPPKHSSAMSNAERQKSRWNRYRLVEMTARGVADDLTKALSASTSKIELKTAIKAAIDKLRHAGGWNKDESNSQTSESESE